MRLAALALAVLLTTTACFPDNPKARTISKLVEGGVLVGGIAIEGAVNSGDDCSTDPSQTTGSCMPSHSAWETIGLVMIVAGLAGFAATVATTPDDKTQATPSPSQTALPPPPPPAIPAGH